MKYGQKKLIDIPQFAVIQNMSRDMRFPTMCDQQSLRPACAYAQTDQSLCWSLKYSLTVKPLTEHHLEFLSLTGGCRGSSESTHVKMPHCWKSHVTTHIICTSLKSMNLSRSNSSPFRSIVISSSSSNLAYSSAARSLLLNE